MIASNPTQGSNSYIKSDKRLWEQSNRTLQSWKYADEEVNLYFLWTHKDVYTNRTVQFHSFIFRRPGPCWWHWTMSNSTFISWCNVNLRQCGGILRMPSNTFPPFLFEHKATNTHLNTPYFTTFGSKLRCNRWEILALRQNSQAKVASVAFSILYLVLH